MTRILVFDTETTGLQEDKDARVIEIGAAIIDTGVMAITHQMGCIADVQGVDKNPAEEVNHISVDAIRTGIASWAAWATFAHMANCCDVIAAHNMEFDDFFLQKEATILLGNSSLPHSDVFTMKDNLDCGILKKMCTLKDFEWDGVSGRKVVHICAELGVPVFGAHRALYDVLMLCECMMKYGKEHIEKMVRKLDFPIYTVQALVGFSQKELAKEQGFKWEPKKKIWYKEFRAESQRAIIDAAK
jgi:DNA polymerase III alpha subunit (gram-positive type)